jgi:hypothetical protein
MRSSTPITNIFDVDNRADSDQSLRRLAVGNDRCIQESVQSSDSRTKDRLLLLDLKVVVVGVALAELSRTSEPLWVLDSELQLQAFELISQRPLALASDEGPSCAQRG